MIIGSVKCTNVFLCAMDFQHASHSPDGLNQVSNWLLDSENSLLWLINPTQIIDSAAKK